MPSQNTPGSLFKIFFLIGLQSFGGGSSTFMLVFEASRKYHWMEDGEFVRKWGLSQLSPGINLMKMAILIGMYLCGWKGGAAAVFGLTLPSAAITALMTAGFSTIHDHPYVVAALKGILPATIGLSLAMGVQMALPLLRQAHSEGKARLAAGLALIAVAALLMGGLNFTPLLVLILSGLVGVAVFSLIPSEPLEAQSRQ